MVQSRANFTVIICWCLICQPLLATKKSNINEYLVENLRTRMTKNFIMENEQDEIPGVIGIKDNPGNPDLPDLILDYANMIRNDIVLLDDTMETKTRKRDNIKLEEHNLASKDTCSCEYYKEVVDLGNKSFPQYLETKVCSNDMCPNRICRNSTFSVTVLKRKTNVYESSEIALPEDLRNRWVAMKKRIVTGCTCSNLKNNN